MGLSWTYWLGFFSPALMIGPTVGLLTRNRKTWLWVTATLLLATVLPLGVYPED
jgi:hypothetical protein